MIGENQTLSELLSLDYISRMAQILRNNGVSKFKNGNIEFEFHEKKNNQNHVIIGKEREELADIKTMPVEEIVPPEDYSGQPVTDFVGEDPLDRVGKVIL